MSLPALYTIADNYVAIVEQLLENGGEVTEELAAQLAQVEDDFDTKAERIALLVRQLVVTGAAAEEEANRLQALAGRRLTAASGLKDYLRREMERVGKTKIERDIVSLRIVKNARPSIRWSESLETLPEAFRRVRVELDGEAAQKALASRGMLPPGFTVVHGTHLRLS